MADKKIIKQSGDNPFAMIDSNISITIEADNQNSEEMKQFHKDVKRDLKDTKGKISGLRNYLTTIINKGFDKIRSNIGYDFALNMNSLQRGGNYHPPLSPILLEREATLSIHEPYLNDSTWFHIYGDVLTGKTHYLYLLSKKLNSKNNIWIKCKQLDSEQANMAIKLSLAEFTKKNLTAEKDWFENVAEKLGQDTVLILDDLPAFQINDTLFENLNFIYSAYKKYGLKVISSGSMNLPHSLTKNFDSDTVKSIQVPTFTDEDIIKLIQIKNNSLKNTQYLAVWIGAVTKYNPSLIVACVEYLDSKNWDITKEVYTNIQNGFYSLELNREVRDLLLNDIHDSDTKELLYRLSIINTEFDDRYVDKISSISPHIIHPYDKVHLLEGYWLQRTSEGYRVSPFVDKIGVTNLSSNIIKEIHSRIALILSESKVLSPAEFIRMFNHLIQAEEFNHAAHALFLALTELNNADIDKDYWAISSIWYDTPLPMGISKGLRLLIRAKQIIICQKFNKDITHLINELDSIDEDNQFIGAIYLMLAFELIDYNLELSLTYLEKVFNRNNDKLITEEFKENIEELIWLYPTRIKGDIYHTNRLIDIINKMSEEQIEKAFHSDMSYDGVMLLVDNIWLEEVQLDESERDWTRCIQLFDKIKEIGLNRKNPILFSCAIRALIMVKFEYLNKEEEAVSLYNAALSFEHNDDSLFLLHSIIGKQFIYKKNYATATSYFLSAVELNSSNYPYEKLDAYVFTAKCLEGINSAESLRYLKEAKELNANQEVCNELINSKLLGEIGICYFNENMYAESYKYLKDSLNILRKIEEKDNVWESMVVVFGHVLGYIASMARTGIPPKEFDEKETYTKPSIGMIWMDNNKRHEYYNSQLEFRLNLLMGYLAGATNNYEDEFYWLSTSQQELKENNITCIFSLLNKQELLPHLIIQRKFVEAINNGIEFSIEFVSSRDSGKQERDVFEPIDIETTINDTDRLNDALQIAIQHVFIPLMFYLSEMKIKNKEDIIEITEKIVRNLEFNKQKYNNCKVFDTIIKVFKMAFLENHNERDFLNGTNECSNNEKILFYVALSIIASKRNAMDLHLKMVVYLYNLYKNEDFIFLKIVTPFYKTFWMYSYINDRLDFQNTEKIDANLEGILKGNDTNTLKQLLHLMNLGLKIPASVDVLKFLATSS